MVSRFLTSQRLGEIIEKVEYLGIEYINNWK